MYHQVARDLQNNSHVTISPENEWFKKCVDFFVSNNPNCDANNLATMVMEQLSLSDFQEIGLSSLPVNLNCSEKTILNGKYCLQVNSILDVGHSCYTQYNVLVKRDTSNTEIGDSKPAPWEPKSHRMLKMTCTDGQQNVLAMEYEPLSCLKEPFIPGFKIAVVGPVEYRKGVLLLKSNNVHFLGGEVEHLLIKNAPLNVLCKVLNKPELKNPYMFSSIEVENTEEQEVSRAADPSRPLENAFRPQNNTNENKNSNFVGNGTITYDDFFDGDDDELLYLTQVAERETTIAQSDNIVNSTPLQTNTHQPSSKTNKPNSTVSTNKNIGTKNTQTSSARQTKISDMLAPKLTKAPSTFKTPNSLICETSRHQNEAPVEIKSVVTKQESGKRVASSPIHTEFKRTSDEFHNPEDIWDDIVMDVDISDPLIKVLKSVSIIKYSKIQVKQNDWICSGTIVDDTMIEKEVEFSSEVLESLIGISSKEVIEFKNNPLNCATLKEKIEKGIKGAYRKLHLFKGELTLTYSIDGDKKPIVTNMIL